jgi:hypothetical protein
VEAVDDVSLIVSACGEVAAESVEVEDSFAKCPGFSDGVVAFEEVEVRDG